MLRGEVIVKLYMWCVGNLKFIYEKEKIIKNIKGTRLYFMYVVFYNKCM